MTAPPEPRREPPPARDAPAIIALGPPPPEPPQKKKPKRQRARMAFIRLDDQEFAELERRAGEAGLSIGAFCRSRTLGNAGPRARRRAPVDTTALMQGLAAFNRAHNNLNQATRALNTIALFAEEHGAGRLVEMLDELNRAIGRLDDEFAAPVAAILDALDVREG